MAANVCIVYVCGDEAASAFVCIIMCACAYAFVCVRAHVCVCVSERELENSKTLFYKDCSLGSVKNLSNSNN